MWAPHLTVLVQRIAMKILLVYPAFPKTYWGAEYTMKFVGKKSILPPLGLLTVAAMLPPHWEARLCDMNVRALETSDLAWADAIFVSGMLVQREGLHEVARLARAANKPVVAGGPYASTSPEVLQPHVDCLVVGEAEEIMDTLIAALEKDPSRLPRRLEASGRPDLALTPVPRFELLDISAYHSIGVQYSRGCPFNCEFCDIIEIYGRTPRVKSAAQFCRELDAVYESGFRGSVFVVDDNFIGHKLALPGMLKQVASWLRLHRDPFDFYTEASINLANDDSLISAMTEAGFTQVFVGIETPSREALRDAGKFQNTNMDLIAAVRKLTTRGLEVMAGFIIGFDSDDADALSRLHDWISQSPIPLAMVGVLTALPGTQLHRRLEREGRLLHDSSGDQFGHTNFITKLEEVELLEGYARIMSDLYSPRSYLRRAAEALELCPKDPSRLRYPKLFGLGVLMRVIWSMGVRSNYRREFWTFFGRVLRRAPARFARAIGLAIHGYHMIRYTREDVMPRLRTAIAEAKLRLAARLKLEDAQTFCPALPG
jgi:radical SAM superfamily enzyme YgiQ (UPF0313 family)